MRACTQAQRQQVIDNSSDISTASFEAGDNEPDSDSECVLVVG